MTTNPSEHTPAASAPTFLYGTAWKEQATERLVRMALEVGFRGIDTANQRRHYHEEGVGRALAGAFADGIVSREQLFLQTKFTHLGGQDHRLPYDPRAEPAEQVRRSFESSLEHLGVSFLDSYVLHGPCSAHGLQPADLEVWAAMEELHVAGRARHLGASNVSLEQLRELHARASVGPAFVQNRCFAVTGWDRDVRRYCLEHGMVYQAFSLLTANRAVLGDPRLSVLATSSGWTPAQVIFRFAQQVGMLPITGTTDPVHARQDLAVSEQELPDDAVALVEGIAG